MQWHVIEMPAIDAPTYIYLIFEKGKGFNCDFGIVTRVAATALGPPIYVGTKAHSCLSSTLEHRSSVARHHAIANQRMRIRSIHSIVEFATRHV
jgi:hypothetical protein